MGNVGAVNDILETDTASQHVCNAGNPGTTRAQVVFSAVGGVTQVAVNQQHPGTGSGNGTNQAEAHKTLALVGLTACNHDALNVLAAQGQVDTQLVDGLSGGKGQLREVFKGYGIHSASSLAVL